MDGKVVAITGGAQGIGFETAKLLLSRGARVWVGDLDEAKLASAEQSLQAAAKDDRVRFSRLNVADSESVNDFFRQIAVWAGRLDGAVNAAGINLSQPHEADSHNGDIAPSIRETSDARWERILSCNLSGMFYCLRSELNSIEDGGSIVCIASVQGLLGFATSAAYSASKHGVIGLARSAAKENGERNVRVNAVAPGAIDTRMVLEKDKTDIKTPIKRIGKPEEVAHLIAFLLGDNSKFITGAVYPIDGGWAC